MSQVLAPDMILDLEDLGLPDTLGYDFALTRRELLTTLGGGIIFVCLAPAAIGQESGRGRGRAQRGPLEVSAWLHIDESGAITVFTGKVEIGQNARTSLTQVAAEELRVPVSSIAMVMGDTDRTPWDAGTFGSQTTPQMVPQIRRAAAAAREMLVDLAAEQWKVDRATLVVAGGKVTNPATKAALKYGQLTRGQKLTKASPPDVPTTPATEWKVEGHSIPKVNAREMVTGQHRYATDVKVPGMLHGKVVRPKGFEAELVSVDTKAAEAMPGVIVVRDGSFVGVAAPDSATALKAAAAIGVEWKVPAQPSNAELFGVLRGTPGGPGPLDAELAGARHTLKQTYTVAYIAHTPLEPRAAVAQWEGGKLTVWTGTQRPFGVKSELAQAFRLPEEQVRVLVPDVGSGYGGKHTGDAAIEAARLATAAGKPVKVLWTREEEFTWAYFRPAGVIEVASGYTDDGTITVWDFHNYNSGPSGLEPPYDVEHKHVQYHQARSPLRQGSYRGLAATANHFARETHVDEIAHALKMDPLELRLKNIKDPRVRAVLEAAAKKFGWGAAKAGADRGVGIACGFEKGGFIATAAEVAVDRAKGQVRVLRLATAFECGAIINPDHLRNQVEGGVIMALGGALTEEVRFASGTILNPRLSDYRVPRFRDVPKLDTVLLDRKDLPSAGAGETPLMAVAPAIGSAIFDATGIRIRSMPMAPNGLKV